MHETILVKSPKRLTGVWTFVCSLFLLVFLLPVRLVRALAAAVKAPGQDFSLANLTHSAALKRVEVLEKELSSLRGVHEALCLQVKDLQSDAAHVHQLDAEVSETKRVTKCTSLEFWSARPALVTMS